MKKYLKKIAKKLKNISSPEEVFNKKALLLVMIFVALFYDILIWSSAKSIMSIKTETETKIISPLEKNIGKMVANHPIEKMVPYISAKDKKVAAFLVGIAKKESNWGKYSPQKDGRDCFNYWGYRGQSENMTESGYTCFSNPRQAVTVVGRRINNLINESNLDTPEKMIVWKCGWDCTGHGDKNVSKWIADVGYYYRKVYQ